MRKLERDWQPCPVCEKQIKIDEELADQEEVMIRRMPMLKTKCPHCQQTVLVDLWWEEPPKC